MYRSNCTDGCRCRVSRSRLTRAFTLVELLVVVSIIGLLIAIMLPSLRRARDQAKTTKCFANLHALHVALVCYADDNKQELPSYTTMGEWGFRVRPGNTLRYNSGEGGYPEYHGIQAVLHNGYGPPALRPNGLPNYGKLLQKPVYIASDSDVWICPANIGPKGHEQEWKTFGNTYYYRTNKSGVSDDPESDNYITPTKEYNIDYLCKRQYRYEDPDTGEVSTRLRKEPVYLFRDNHFAKPLPSGMGRPDKVSDYNYQSSEWRAPHRVGSSRKPDGSNKSATSFSVRSLADGQVKMAAWGG